MDFYYFYAGKEFEAYNWLGAHPDHHGTTFRTYAPNARNIYVTGDFNNWQKTPMNRVYDGKFFEVHVDNAKPMDLYKYQIEQADGRIVDHCDPYGFSAELRPGWASRIVDLTKYHWHDDKWMRGAGRGAQPFPAAPVGSLLKIANYCSAKPPGRMSNVDPQQPS